MALLLWMNEKLNAFVWGPVMLAMFMLTGVFLSVKTGFVQAVHFRRILRGTVGSLSRKRNGGQDENLSPFQAMTTALAGTVGTGNIAGVTGAMFIGGAGSVFWMWLSAFFGMCTKYAEIVLAVKFRRTDAHRRNYGGPMYYIEDGLGKDHRWLAVCFALFGGMASFGIGNIAQSCEISGALGALFSLSPRAVGLGLAMLVALVTIGGIKRIGRVTALLVPVMSLFFILAGLYIIIVRFAALPLMLARIFSEALSINAVGGGIFGASVSAAIRQGVARGVFSNEAGLGSAPIAHAASSAKEPCEQAMWGIFEVFMDTIIICSITAFALMLSGVLDTPEGAAYYASNGDAAADAFSRIFHSPIGGDVIRISLVFFAFSSIISWCYYGESCFAYLSGGSRLVSYVYKLCFSAVCYAGCVGSGTLMWSISDTLNGLMAIPNLIALLLLSGTVARLTRDYFQ